MKKYIIGLGIIGMSVGILVAQTQKPPKKVSFKGKSYLYGGMISGGKISKSVFDSLIAYPLVASDTANNMREVVRFMFTYAERGLYEDSTGRPRIMTEYYYTEGIKDKLPEDWVPVIRKRSKAGDTALFYDITAAYPDTLHKRFYTEPIKLIITD
jgi:hypothetical protein